MWSQPRLGDVWDWLLLLPLVLLLGLGLPADWAQHNGKALRGRRRHSDLRRRARPVCHEPARLRARPHPVDCFPRVRWPPRARMIRWRRRGRVGRPQRYSAGRGYIDD